MSNTAETEGRARSAGKSATAFRTISEVSAELEVPQHVLRFWETKFPQIRPLKRGGGRRYYRPDDVELLRRIQHLLYKEGYTIKGVQRLLKEMRGQLPAHPEAAPQSAGLFDLDEADAANPVEDGLEEDAGEPAPGPEHQMEPESRRPSRKAGTLPATTRRTLETLLDDLLEVRGLLRP